MANWCYDVFIANLAKRRKEVKVLPTDSNLLRGMIATKGYTQKEIADIIGISRQSFSDKLNNKSTFKVSEIIKLCEVLDITDKDRYFFAAI